MDSKIHYPPVSICLSEQVILIQTWQSNPVYYILSQQPTLSWTTWPNQKPKKANILNKTYGLRRDGQPAWASNCEGLTCSTKVKEFMYREDQKQTTTLFKLNKHSHYLRITASTKDRKPFFVADQQFLPNKNSFLARKKHTLWIQNKMGQTS